MRNKFQIGSSCSKESIQNILDLKTPAHIVYFYRNEQQRLDTLCPIFVGALRRDYGCVFVGSQSHSMGNLESTVKRQIGLCLDGSTECDRIISLTGEDLMVAITFAEAGDSETAKRVLKKEKRRFSRVPVYLEVGVKRSDRPLIKARSFDISEGGIRLFLPERLLKGEVMELEIGLSVTPVIARGKVVWIQEMEDKFFQTGIRFKGKYAVPPQTRTTKVTLAIERLIERGCKKIMAVGNMTWAKKVCKDVAHLFKYESQLNVHLFSFPTVIAICEYHIPKFSKKELLQALYTHPLVLYECVVYRNTSYVPPPIWARYNQR